MGPVRRGPELDPARQVRGGATLLGASAGAPPPAIGSRVRDHLHGPPLADGPPPRRDMRRGAARGRDDEPHRKVAADDVQRRGRVQRRRRGVPRALGARADVPSAREEGRASMGGAREVCAHVSLRAPELPPLLGPRPLVAGLPWPVSAAIPGGYRRGQRNEHAARGGARAKAARGAPRVRAERRPAMTVHGGPVQKQKIAILGGGMAALTAAFELTRDKERAKRYEITVYQTGHRLGGKGASGRNRA